MDLYHSHILTRLPLMRTLMKTTLFLSLAGVTGRTPRRAIEPETKAREPYGPR